MIGIEAIVACIMSIDKDDPPRRGAKGPGGANRGQQTKSACSVIMQEGCRCVLYREKEGFNLLVLFIQKAPFCLLTDVSAHRPSISLLGGRRRLEET